MPPPYNLRMVLREYAEFASAASAEGNNQYAYPPPLLTKVTLRSFDRTRNHSRAATLRIQSGVRAPAGDGSRRIGG